MSINDITNTLNSLTNSLSLDTAISSAASLPNDVQALMIPAGTDASFDQQLYFMQTSTVQLNAKLLTLSRILTDLLSRTNLDIEPDFDATTPNWYQLSSQFQSWLATKPGWSQQFAATLGTTLSELVAATTSFLIQGTETALQESFPNLAQRDSSVYAGMNMLGVNIGRKTGACVSVQLTRSDYTVVNINITISQNYYDVDPTVFLDPANISVSVAKAVYTTWTLAGNRINFGTNMIGQAVSISIKYLPNQIIIPKFSTFSVSKPFFNKDIISFASHQTTCVATLYEGIIKTYSAIGSSDFYTVTLPDSFFTVDDVNVSINNVWWTCVDSLWAASPTDTVFMVITLGTGETQIVFGDNLCGKSVNNLPITVQYSVTSGSAGNVPNIGIKVLQANNSNIVGTSLTPVTGGSDEKGANVYRTIGPYMSNNQQIIRKQQYVAHILNFPNVSDVVVNNQADIDPQDLRWMNTVRICCLPTTGDKLSNEEWSALTADLYAHSIDFITLVRTDPSPYNVNISVVVYKYRTVINDVVVPVTAAINKLFVRCPKFIGKAVTMSDVIAATRSPDIDYVEVKINGDTGNIVIPAFRYAVLSDLNIFVQVSSR